MACWPLANGRRHQGGLEGVWAIATRLPAAALPAEADQAWPRLISRYDGPGPTLQ
jgi:hypothetical protein